MQAGWGGAGTPSSRATQLLYPYITTYLQAEQGTAQPCTADHHILEMEELAHCVAHAAQRPQVQLLHQTGVVGQGLLVRHVLRNLGED